MKPETQNWIGLAQEDYENSLYLFRGARHPAAIYYLCQAVEKVLKAVQIENLDQYPKKIVLVNKSVLVKKFERRANRCRMRP